MARLTEDELLANVAACSTEVLDWAEREGYANLKAHIDSGAAINAQAASTLQLLLGGIGGALAFAVKLAEPGAGPVAWGAATVCAWWMAVAAYLTVRNMNLVDAPMLSNQPGHLLLPGATHDQLRRGELVNVEMRIRDQRDMNQARGNSLNRARWAALVGPAWFAAGAVAARWLA